MAAKDRALGNAPRLVWLVAVAVWTATLAISLTAPPSFLLTAVSLAGLAVSLRGYLLATEER